MYPTLCLLCGCSVSDQSVSDQFAPATHNMLCTIALLRCVCVWGGGGTLFATGPHTRGTLSVRQRPTCPLKPFSPLSTPSPTLC